MLSCCVSVYCIRNALIVSLSLSTFLSFYLFPLSCNLFFSFYLSLPLSSHLFLSSHPLHFPLSLLFSLSASVIGDFKLPLNFIINPTLLLLPLLPPAKHTKICNHTRKLMLTCHQNPQFRVTINKSMSETFGEKGDWERKTTARKLEVPYLQRAKKYLLRRLLHTNQQMHTEQKKEIRLSKTCK